MFGEWSHVIGRVVFFPVELATQVDPFIANCRVFSWFIKLSLVIGWVLWLFSMSGCFIFWADCDIRTAFRTTDISQGLMLDNGWPPNSGEIPKLSSDGAWNLHEFSVRLLMVVLFENIIGIGRSLYILFISIAFCSSVLAWIGRLYLVIST